MNILWIEDFGANLNARQITAINLFKNLIPDRVFDEHWDRDAPDLFRDPNYLSQFFQVHSLVHNVTLLRHYGEFAELEHVVTDYDAIAIDINLSRNVPKDVPVPAGYADGDAFHKQAGIYIFNQLVRSGFPDSQICFLTGEKGSTFSEFEEHCRKAFIPRPTAFNKDDAGYAEFRAWLDTHRQSNYTTLRRGVIEGCKFLKQLIADETRIQFGEFLDAGTISKSSIDDYLSLLSICLPVKQPSDMHLALSLRLQARAIAHVWENKARPGNIGHDQLRGRSTVMKLARNWMAHSDALNAIEPADVAFLFLVNMRAMFRMEPPANRFERILLSVLSDGDSLPGKQELHRKLEESYRGLVAFYRQLDPPPNPDLEKPWRLWYFNNLANEAHLIETKRVDAQEASSYGLRYMALLYQVLWQQLAQRPPIDPEQYNCDPRPKTFRVSESESDSLMLLMSAIYLRSFL